jgi:hypothetical protein
MLKKLPKRPGDEVGRGRLGATAARWRRAGGAAGAAGQDGGGREGGGRGTGAGAAGGSGRGCVGLGCGRGGRRARGGGWRGGEKELGGSVLSVKKRENGDPAGIKGSAPRSMALTPLTGSTPAPGGRRQAPPHQPRHHLRRH